MSDLGESAMATPTPSNPRESKQSPLQVLLAEVKNDPSRDTGRNLHGFLTDNKQSLELNVKVVGEPKEIPFWSETPVIKASWVSTDVLWDGETMQFRDDTARVGPRKDIRFNVDLSDMLGWHFILTPSQGSEFLVKITEADKSFVVSAPLAAALVSLLLSNPAVFQTTTILV